MCVSECTAGYPCCCNRHCYIRASSTGQNSPTLDLGLLHTQCVFKHWEHKVPVATYAGYKLQQHSQVAVKVHPHWLAKAGNTPFLCLGSLSADSKSELFRKQSPEWVHASNEELVG